MTIKILDLHAVFPLPLIFKVVLFISLLIFIACPLKRIVINTE